MKLLKKQWFAVVVTLVLIAGSVAWSLLRTPAAPAVPAVSGTAAQTDGSGTISDPYIRDEAGLLPASAERTIRKWNDRIASYASARVAIFTETSSSGSIGADTAAMFSRMGLSERDMLLGLDVQSHTWYVELGSVANSYADAALQAIFEEGADALLAGTDMQEDADDLYDDLYDWFRDVRFGKQKNSSGRGLLGTLITVIIVVMILRALSGGGRRGRGGGGGRFVSGLFLGSLLSGGSRRSGGMFRGGGFGGRGGFGGGRGGFGG